MVNDHTRHGYRLASITPYDHVNAYLSTVSHDMTPQ